MAFQIRWFEPQRIKIPATRFCHVLGSFSSKTVSNHVRLLEVSDMPLITPQNPELRHKKNAPEYPTAGAEVRRQVYSDREKRIGPVFSSVEKAQDYLSRR